MKIGFSAVGPKLDSLIDFRFGRCQYFLILDEKGKLEKALPNPGAGATRGAGIVAAQTIINEGVKVLIVENIGPNAFLVLQSAGIKVYLAAPGSKIEQALDKYKKGKLEETKDLSR